MRILAIRGCNLASLAGEFEVDLATGALGDAGVFAIVGPTGAGKSTLLDAMCVALFDRTPRLTNRSTVVVGRGDDDPAALGAQDVRTLLRRGATAGWAEVDFESGDARRYRARWSVRRARGATDGRIQDQQVTLVEMGGPSPGGIRLGGTKSETLKAIHERLGLSFDQFRRSALLAQGEFATFLRAEGKDRSELLERMTGTEIYTRLSIAAHAKAMLAEQQLRDRAATAAAIAVVSDDDRGAAEAAIATARATQDTARVRLAAADAAARWLVEAEQRRRALELAELADRQAQDSSVAASADRAELALRRRAEALRPAWDAAAWIERQLAIARGELAVAGVAATRAVAEYAAVVARRTRLGELHAPVREARLAAGLVERAPASIADVEDAACAAAADAAWLIARRALGPEIAGWTELDAKLGQHRALAEAIAAADHALAEHGAARADLVARRAVVVAERGVAVASLDEARREAAAYHQRRGLTLDAAGRQEDEARTRHADAERLVAIAAAAREVAATIVELDVRLADLATVIAVDDDRRAVAASERDAAAALQVERSRVASEVRRVAGYQHARTELVDGEPCPLCGAAEHPWRDRGAFDALIGDAEARLVDAVRRGDAAVAELARLDGRHAQHAVECQRLASEHAAMTASAVVATRKWRDELAALGELMLVGDPATAAAERLATERVSVARGRLEAARVARSQAEAASKAIADAQARVQARHADVEHQATKLAELDITLAALDAAIERARGERGGRAERYAELTAELPAALARWPVPDDVDPRAAVAELAAAWRGRADKIGSVDAALAAELAAVDHAVRAAALAVAEHAARRADLARRCDGLVAELGNAAGQLAAARSAAGFDADELRRLLSVDAARVAALAEMLEALDRAADRARTLVAERRRLVDEHAEREPVGLADAPLIAELADAVAAADQRTAALGAMLAADGDARVRRAAALAALVAAERAAVVDRVVGQMIGSHDGKLFRSFAQSLTLDALLAVANSHLEELAPRYQLERVPKHDLELQVIDRDLGGEVRSVQSLSGGEGFLVSLALALGLSSMSAHDVRVRTLLIDEGFGTLDPATLDSALAVLDVLKSTGRQIGVISHVPALVDRVGAHVRVAPRGGGRSEVIVEN